jgi:hypothetical protein
VGEGGGRFGSSRASPAPEQSVGLASQVNLESTEAPGSSSTYRKNYLSYVLSVRSDEEGLAGIIRGLDAVGRVVLLEVEQAARTKGIMTMKSKVESRMQQK